MPSISVVLLDVGVIVGAAVLIGATAPRWPASWLQRDSGPLHLARWETPRRYRALGISALARRLPELGRTFGGASKAAVADRSLDGLRAYAIEVRRAEWVHWLSTFSAVVLFAFNPWWLALLFVAATAAINAPFIAVLRHNRLRLRRITGRIGAPREH